MNQNLMNDRMGAWLEEAWLAHYLDRELTAEECAWFESYALDKGDLLSRIEADTALRNALIRAANEVVSKTPDRMQSPRREHQKLDTRPPRLQSVRAFFGENWRAIAASVLLVACGGASWRFLSEQDRRHTAEHEARKQTLAAERMGGILAGIFEAWWLRDSDHSIEALDDSAKRVRSELADEPRIQATIFKAIAYAYRGAGKPEREITYFRDATDLFLDPRVNDPLSAAAALSQLAIEYANNNYPHGDAESAARRSLELRVRHQGSPLALADSYNTLGVVLDSELRYSEAEVALRRGLDLFRGNAAPAVDIAASLQNLALVGTHVGNPKVAVGYYEEALTLVAASKGTHNQQYEQILSNYGQALGKAGRTEEAVAILLEDLALAREIYGNDSAPTGLSHNEVASALHDLGRFREALPHYLETIRINGLTDTERGIKTAKAINNAASLYEDMGAYAAAIPLFRESLSIRERLLEGDDPIVLGARNNLGRVLAKAGQFKDARDLLDSVHISALERYGESNDITVKATLWLAIVEARLGNLRAAAAGLEKLDNSSEGFTPLMLATRSKLRAEVAEARHDEAAALQARKDAWAEMKNGLGAHHPLTAEFGIEYAVALADAGQSRLAREVARPLLAIIDSAFVPGAEVRQKAARWKA